VTVDTRLVNAETPPEAGTDFGPDVVDVWSGRARAGVTTAVDETGDRSVDGEVAEASVAAGCAVRGGPDDPHATHGPANTVRATHRTSPRRTPS